MKEIFKELIVDFHASTLPHPQRRNITLPHLPKNVRKAFVFIGMRRSGKTWALYQIMQDLLISGIDLTKILYLNFEDERLINIEPEHFQDILKAYFELYPEYLERSDLHFFFDEIQEKDGWERFIRRLLDQEKMAIYITGSSAKMLSKEIASSLRGRTFTQEIFPFSFIEYLQAFNVATPAHFGTKSSIEIVHHFENFLQWGGFPEVIDTTPEIHRSLLQEYISSVIYRDVIERYGVTNSQALKQLLLHCLRNSATVFSIKKMYDALKTMGYGVSKNSLYEYMSYFQDAYCVFSLGQYHLSHRKAMNSMKKIFAIDQGLITAVTLASNFDKASQLETAVFSYLRRKSESLFYYRTQKDKEVDFVQILPDQTTQLFQVCVTLKNADTYQREIDGLMGAMDELKVSQGVIITLDDREEQLKVTGGTIHIVPAWKMFIGSNALVQEEPMPIKSPKPQAYIDPFEVNSSDRNKYPGRTGRLYPNGMSPNEKTKRNFIIRFKHNPTENDLDAFMDFLSHSSYRTDIVQLSKKLDKNDLYELHMVTYLSETALKKVLYEVNRKFRLQR